jgi:hypothetical protein
MKMRTLFNLIEDADEIAGLFAKVETPEQMVSLLERLKKQGATEFLDSVQSLRLSLQAAMEDTLEIGGSIGSDDDDNFADDVTDGEDDLLEGIADEDENIEAKTDEQEKKS